MRRILPLIALVCLSGIAFAEEEARWWRGNLHTHTLWSDGDDYPEMIAAWYKEQGYHFLGLSDHNVIQDHERWINVGKSRGKELALEKYIAKYGKEWVELREGKDGQEVRLKMLSEFRGKVEEPGRFLMIQSEEITDHFLKTPIHINVTNVQEKITPQGGRSVVEVMQKNVDAVLEQRKRTGVPMFPHINHPNFHWAITAEELMQVEGERFFEVYNGHPQVYSLGDAKRAGTDRMWDIILAERLTVLGKEPMYGLANDDSHNYHVPPGRTSRPGRGWVMVRAKELSTKAIIGAMEAGDFYASSGVFLKDVQRGKNELTVEIEPQEGVEFTTEFIGTRKGYDRTSEPVIGDNGGQIRTTRRYSDQIGAVLATVKGTKAVYTLKGDEIYVRARVTSSRKHPDPSEPGEFERAWTQPLVTGVK